MTELKKSWTWMSSAILLGVLAFVAVAMVAFSSVSLARIAKERAAVAQAQATLAKAQIAQVQQQATQNAARLADIMQSPFLDVRYVRMTVNNGPPLDLNHLIFVHPGDYWNLTRKVVTAKFVHALIIRTINSADPKQATMPTSVQDFQPGTTIMEHNVQVPVTQPVGQVSTYESLLWDFVHVPKPLPDFRFCTVALGKPLPKSGGCPHATGQ